MKITQVVAVDKNGIMASSKFNGMLWRCPSDLKRFKNLTMKSPIIMGRKTYESIGRPLPFRLNIVLTKKLEGAYELEGVDHRGEDLIFVDHPAKALIVANQYCKDYDKQFTDDVYVIGGREIYSIYMPMTDYFHVTQIDVETSGDMYYTVPLGIPTRLIESSHFSAEEGDPGDQIVNIYKRI
jgi:dihydrofolate reductase